MLPSQRSRSFWLPPFKRRLSQSRNRPTLLGRHQVHEATPEDILGHHENLTKLQTVVHRPPPLFPWRHKEELLPRLIPGTPEYQYNGNTFGPSMPNFPPMWKHILTTIGGTYLKVPWYRILGNGWKQDLANSSSFAFSQAVAGILCNTYNLSEEAIRGDEFDVDLDIAVNIEKPHTLAPQKDPSVSEKDRRGDDGGDDDDDGVDNDAEAPDLEDMVHAKLRNLYESAHQNGKDQMQIRLQLRPTNAQLLSVIVVPFLTRKLVKERPSLQRAYPDMIRKIQMEQLEKGRKLGLVETVKFFGNECEQLCIDTMEEHDNLTTIRSTVIAQVQITCEEVFCVSDVATGKVYQGYGDGKVRSIPHLVRLEVDASTTHGDVAMVNDIGSFQIVDWDDLLEGNIWFI